ncbi:MAG TPA: helix-turn-helix domain-containing protein [Solirubrobacteraceae bacterium]
MALTHLVESPALSPLLSYVSRPRSAPAVERVALIEDLGALGRVSEHAIVLVTRAASAEVSSYQFDIALRVARSRSVAALVLSAADVGRVTPTTIAIADRSGTAILGTGRDVDLAQLAIAIGRELAGGADVALLRVHTVLRAIEAHPADGTMESLLRRAGAALGVALTLVEVEPRAGPRAAVEVEGHVEGWLTAPEQDGDLAMALDVALHAAATGVADVLARAQRAEELPIQSREEVLTELLSAPPRDQPPLIVRARKLGLPIDGWHVAVRLEFEDLADAPAGEEVRAHQTRLRLARAALHAVRGTSGTWHSARAGLEPMLFCMYPDDPGIAATGEVAQVMDRALGRVRAQLPTTLIRCGVGSPHPGPAGLLSSAAEARAAVTAARTSGRVDTVAFDSVGLRRTLVEWYASDVAQEAVSTVLAPLAQLGGARAERLIQTLHVYLDQQGSLTRTAETLNLHRNAVAYRIKQIFSVLDVDRDNPDDLLLLQLACRARELA